METQDKLIQEHNKLVVDTHRRDGLGLAVAFRSLLVDVETKRTVANHHAHSPELFIAYLLEIIAEVLRNRARRRIGLNAPADLTAAILPGINEENKNEDYPLMNLLAGQFSGGNGSEPGGQQSEFPSQ